MTSDNESFCSAINSSYSSDISFSSLGGTLGDSLRDKFCHSLNRQLNVCHINAQSVPSHYSELHEAFTNSNVHAILISETWLKPHLPSTTYPLPGFVLIRNDRVNKRGGGVAVYLRSDFPFKIVAISSPNLNVSAEFLFLEVCVRGAKIALGVVYCPPGSDYFTEFESVLESLGSEYAHHIIMGDFNTNLLVLDSHRSRKLKYLVESASLHVLPLEATHHNVAGEDTWLDLILVSKLPLVYSHGQFDASGFSHHDLIYLSYTVKPPKPKPKILSMRSFARLDVEKLQKDAENICWEPLIEANTLDDKVSFFNQVVTKLFDAHAPVKKIKLKRLPAPWMSKGISMAMRRRNRAFRIFKRDRTDDNWASFKIARNRCNQMIRNAKRRYIHHNISSTSAADIWKFLGTLGIGRARHLDLPSTIGLDDLNKHFSTSSALDHLTQCDTNNYIAGLTRPDISCFSFSPIACGDVKKIILSIKSKAVGCDGISRRMIVLILDQLLPAITHIINSSLDIGAFPCLWKKALVRPLPKILNPSLPNHFRPISILPFLSKTLEACVHKQLSAFIYDNNLLSRYQSGFRPGHSTVSTLLKVIGDVRSGMEDSKLTVLVLIDFSNAFNAVNHDILSSILSYLMISQQALDWFCSYLRDRQQSVRVGDSSSAWSKLECGVPQGGILSPLLFSIFINLITFNLQCSYHLYADDLQLYSQSSVDDISDAVGRVNRDLDAINNWSKAFGVAVNPCKCQALILGSHRGINKLSGVVIPPVIFNGTAIPLSSSVKDLGLLIDSTLGWQTQVANVNQKVTGTLRALYRLKNFLPSTTKAMLVQSLIFPIIDYGDVCYYDLNADLLNKLDRLLNNCIRFVFNTRKYDHVSAHRSLLKWLPIRQRRCVRALTYLFSLLYSPNCPSYLTSHFKFLSSNHSKCLRSSNNRLLLCPSHRSDFLHSTFFVQSILLWNSLPTEIRMASSRYSFKKKIRDHFHKQTLAESS